MKTRGSVSMHILLKIVRLCEDTRIGCGRCDAKENDRGMSWMAFKKDRSILGPMQHLGRLGEFMP